MKVGKLGIFLFLMTLIAFGCSKRPTEVSNLSGLDIEGENKDIVTQTITSPEVEPQPAAQPQPIQVEPQREPSSSVPMPSDELERNRQIQTALKNANLYIGEIDGKIGPLTRKAIEEFQKMKGLKVDGKVGPITWGELEKYLNVAPSKTETKKKR